MANPAIVIPRTKIVRAAPTVSASPAYSANDCIGGLMSFAGVSSGVIGSVVVNCKSAQTFAFDLILFSGNPVNSTFTDNAAVALNAADWNLPLGVVSFTSASWASLGTPSCAEVLNAGLLYDLGDSGADVMYGVLVSRGTATLASTSDISVGIKVLPDYQP